jgi:hypothetical protein
MRRGAPITFTANIPKNYLVAFLGRVNTTADIMRP